ncbi:uncharacterized protein STEHIDRAFT_146026 [Stereum hirsutum FP-91666 SS1]|uniref:uncharacterized protein n=1 Tax=Stereum hirsutum (strain FP-91666) TaxID=721885 RepID=UPI000440AA84|nr:uncharacterized protein STEHIDRAFT_146026 [Stereum hirsutum FP-91666 SS1]EIM87813.1 hypothetical protein STEHIDRAFT_146026 [Stereum hirsutum FP-91666 SS1]
MLDAESKLGGAKVILCTLSMMSNPKLSVFTQAVPVETVIVDEASQIETGNYVPLLHLFKTTVAKVVFIGDDKQLPPYGQENICGLQSVFEISRLRSKAKLLAVQYRMPRVVGSFISRHVYDGKLETVHAITSASACRFVDVQKGREKQEGHSWINAEECHVAVRIAQRYNDEGKDFRIITPYDAQRNLIEGALRRESIPWADKVFNVDAFQGNESDHIIISLVRTEKLGFLRDLRRSNVMLSRCKESMTICSSRTFLEGKGSTSLAGKLAKECGNRAWRSVQDVWNGRL